MNLSKQYLSEFSKKTQQNLLESNVPHTHDFYSPYNMYNRNSILIHGSIFIDSLIHICSQYIKKIKHLFTHNDNGGLITIIRR